MPEFALECIVARVEKGNSSSQVSGFCFASCDLHPGDVLGDWAESTGLQGNIGRNNNTAPYRTRSRCSGRPLCEQPVNYRLSPSNVSLFDFGERSLDVMRCKGKALGHAPRDYAKSVVLEFTTGGSFSWVAV